MDVLPPLVVPPSVNGVSVVHSRSKPRIPKLKKWSVVLVEWLDAVTYEGGMHSQTSNFRCPVRKSVGHFVRRSKTELTLAMEDDRGIEADASDCDNVTSIPLGIIRKVTILEPKA